MQTPRVLLLAPAAVLLVAVLGCAGVTEVDVVPPLSDAEVPAAVAVADTAAEAPAEEAPPEPVPVDGAEDDDGVAAADPDREPRRRAARRGPAPQSEPEAPAGDDEAGDDEVPEEKAPAKKGAKRPPAPPPQGITQVDGTTWHVTQKLVDRWHDDPYKLGNVRESGAGWELIGIRQRNAYHLGMRNSDIVMEVNGRKLNTMPQLLAAYMALKNQKSFDVVFLRSGNRKVHHYEIVN